MAIYNQRIEYTKENLIEHYLKRDSLPDFLYGIIRFVGIIVQNIYCVSSYLVLSWIILFPISWIKSDLYSRVENYLYNSLLFIVSSWSMAAGATIVETGDEYKHLIEYPDRSVINEKSLNANQINKRKVMKHETNSISLNKSKLNIIEDVKHLSKGGSDTNSDLNNHVNQSGDEIKTILQKPVNDLNRTVEYIATSGCPNNVANINNNNFKQKSQIHDNSADLQVNKALINTVHEESSIHGRKPRILLLCNHISTADVPLIMQSFSTLTNQSILWVLDAQVSLEELLRILGHLLIYSNSALFLILTV